MYDINSTHDCSSTTVPNNFGTVVAIQANFYRVHLDKNYGDENSYSIPYLLCTRRSRLKKIGQNVMVGDRVTIVKSNHEDSRGSIVSILPRKTELSRPQVANADQILLLFPFKEPELEPWQLSRFLVKAESTLIPLVLCFNKVDLLETEEQTRWKMRLDEWGYSPLLISTFTIQGFQQLSDCLQNKFTILAGPSGAGKSSLINKLVPNIEQRVNEVSGKLRKGRHTTRHVELFRLPGGGLIADTPGFNQADLQCDPYKLINYFPEAKAQLKQGKCQFNNCLHKSEPNCIVSKNWERYRHYLTILAEILLQKEVDQKIKVQESTLKLKIKAFGKECYEPKLEIKKYRRHSRKDRKQNLQELYENENLEDLE